MAIINEQYPLTTQDGVAIPLDIIKPSGLIFQALTSSAWTSITIPLKTDLVMLKASEDCILDMTGLAAIAFVEGAYNAKALYLPKGFVVAVAIDPGVIKARAVSTATVLYIQGIYKWAALSLPRQAATVTSRK